MQYIRVNKEFTANIIFAVKLLNFKVNYGILLIGEMNMENKSAIERKFDIIKESFDGKAFFSVEDAQSVLNEKKSTLYWNLHNMVEKGLLLRIDQGRYSLNYYALDNQPFTSVLADKISKIILETGFRYYISGIDVLLKHMQHIPESYPIMLFVDSYSKEEIEDILLSNGFITINSKELKTRDTIIKLNLQNDLVILYETEKFDYAKDGFSSNEKAFVDLYYEITRRKYPFSIQELARIYQHMEMRGVIDKKKLVQAAYDRNVHYDMRFIAESKYINEEAFKIVEIIRREQ